MACIERVAYHHVDGFQPRSGHVAQVFHLNNGSERPFGDHPLRAPADAVKLQRTAAVPASQSAQAIGVAHPKHVISHPRRQLRRVGIELRGLQDQSLTRFAVDVHGLSVVIIHPESHQLTFETDAMGVNVMIGVFRAGGKGDGAYPSILPVLCPFLVAAGQDELGVGASGITGLPPILIEYDLIGLALPRLHVHQEAKLVGAAIPVEIVQLAGDFPSLSRDHRTYHVQVIRRQVHYHGLVFSLLLDGIDDGHCQRCLCRTSDREQPRQ